MVPAWPRSSSCSDLQATLVRFWGLSAYDTAVRFWVLARDFQPRMRWELTVICHHVHEEVDLGAECGSLEPSRYRVEGEGLGTSRRSTTPRTDFVIPLTS
jgi:hypothetical protein